MAAGIWTNSFELESASAAVSAIPTPSKAIRHNPLFPAVNVFGVHTRELTRATVGIASDTAFDCKELAAEMVMRALLLAPFHVVDRITHPLGTLTAVATNVAVAAPCGTMTLGGTVSATLLAETPTVIAPAVLDNVTVQLLPPPTFNDAGLQASDVRVGVDHSVNITF
jgi:hypothetical protein